MSLFILAVALLALLFGPLAYPALTRRAQLAAVLDGFVFVSIGALVLAEALPEAVRAGGLWTLVFLAAGVFGPSLLEQLLHKAARQTHIATLLIGGLGLVAHATADGAALGGASVDNAMLPLAVILHRLPVGLAIWWLLRPTLGRGVALTMLIMMMVGTTAGWLAGPALVAQVDSAALAWFQAFVAGSILHVVFNKPHLGGHYATDGHGPNAVPRRFEGAGNLLGMVVVAALIAMHGVIEPDSGHVWAGWQTLLQLALVSAPALLLGYLLAGLMGAFMPAASAQWLRGGNRLSQAVRGMAVGLPLPVCSCGVLPLYRNLVAKGAGGSAAFAFLIATPELGIDAIILSIPLLGGPMTLLRVVAAAGLALFVGWLAGRWVTHAEPVESCCAGESGAPLSNRDKLVAGLKQGFGELVDTTAPWIVFGLLIAVLAEPLLRSPVLLELSPLVQVLAFALIGIPTYVCASGATPIVAVMLVAGVSPGAALAFLLAGPATNVATFGLLGSLHGRMAATVFAMATVGGAVALGLATNLWLGDWPSLSDRAVMDHPATALQQVSLVLLLALYLSSIVRRGARAFFFEGLRGHHAHG